MDRSTTPRASQQQQQPPPPLPQASQPGGGAPRRFKNRSRSGSEELSQIVAQAAARAPLANGFWPLGDYTSPSSRPQSATPTPNTVHRAAAADGEQGRATSPTGLLGWVRTAFMLGPSGRTLASKIDEHDDEHDGYDDADGGLQKRHDDPIFRNQTPLLPGILPSFHHIDRQKRLEPPIEVPASQRSSLDGGRSSVSTHDSLETYDGAARRGSSVSTASTASTYSNGALRRSGERDSDDSDNDEDVYAPFAQRQQSTHTSQQPLQAPAAVAAMNGSAPILVRPTARREPLGFEVPLDAEGEEAPPPSAGPLDRLKFSINGHTSRHAAAAPAKTSNHALSISEAQGTGEYVNDTTEQLTAVPDLVLSPASSSQSNDTRSDRAATASKVALSPLAGWIDVDSSNANTPRPASRNDDGPATVRSSESDERRPAEARFDVSFGQRIEGALASRAARQNGDSSAAALQVVVTTSDGTTAQGDGEELSDVMGRPKSPEELLQNRQSRESVVLGSRGASVRAGHGRSRAVSSSKKLVEEEGDHMGRGSRLRAVSDMTSYVASAAGITEENVTPNSPAAGTLRRRSSATSPTSKVRAAGRSPRPSTSAGDAADRPRLLQGSESASGPALNSPSTPRSRGALAFLSRRGEVAQTRKGDTQSADANNVNSPAAAAAALKTPFWRLGRKSQGKVAAPDDDAEQSPAPVTPSKAKGLSSNTTGGHSSAKSKRASVTSTATGSASNGPSSACPLQASNSDSLAKVNKSARGALGPAMQPKQIRVRSRNKPSRDREFGTMYLAQELFLGHSAPSLVRRVTPPHASPKATSHDGHDTQSQHGSASPPSTANNDSGFGECASSDGHSVPQSNGGAHSKRRATWAMRFSLDGKHLAVAGQDAVIRIYAVLDTPNARQHALDEVCGGAKGIAEAASTDANGTAAESGLDEGGLSTQSEDKRLLVFSPEPVREFRGHSSDVLDLSWSKGGFLLSASMDKTARVWHLSRPSSLAAFVHGDFVTAAVFHPRDDRFFLSGSLDGKIRLWNISAKKVHASQQVPGLITACSFTHSGSHVCVGTFSGAALFYRTDSLSFVSSVAVRSPSGCGGNAKHQKGGRKVTAIEPILPDATSEQASRSAGDDRRGERVLITSNDSRVRAYDLSTQSFVVRFKAKTYNNRTSQIRATLSDDNAFIIAGSETVSSSDGGQIHIWSCSATLFDVTTKSLLSKLATGSLNAMAAANQRTTSLLRRGSTSARRSDESSLALPDVSPTPSSKSKKKTNDTVLEDSVEYFTAHASTVTCAIMAPMGTSKLLRQANDPIQLRSEAVLRARLEENNVGGSLVGLADTLVGLPVYLGKTMYTALFTPLRLTTGGIGANTAATRAAQQSPVQRDDAVASLNDKLNHVLVSVDDNAVVRVWRSDSLNTMSV